MTPGDRDAFPTSDTFTTGDNFTFSPDGKYLVFTAVPEKDEAWSTNYEICRVPVTGGTTKWECLTKDNQAAEQRAAVLAGWQATRVPGPEAAGLRGRPLGADGRRDATPSGGFKGKPRSI